MEKKRKIAYRGKQYKQRKYLWVVNNKKKLPYVYPLLDWSSSCLSLSKYIREEKQKTTSGVYLIHFRATSSQSNRQKKAIYMADGGWRIL